MMTDYERNRLLNWRFRGQTMTPEAQLWVGVLSAADATGGTEVTGGGLARAAISSSLAAWSNTIADGTTTAGIGGIEGTRGLISNNLRIVLASALTVGKTFSYAGLWDAEVGGQLRYFGLLYDTDGNAISRSYAVGDEVAFEPAALQSIIS